MEAEPRDGRADAAETIGGHGKTRERVMLRRIETEGDDQCARRKGTNGFLRRSQRLHVAVIPGADRQRDVEIGAKPLPAPRSCAWPQKNG